jgi:hypothetical protein
VTKLASIVCALALSASLAAGIASAQSASQNAALTIIREGSLIDETSDTPRKNQLIFVRGDRIEKIADANTQIPTGANVIDLSSSTVLSPVKPCGWHGLLHARPFRHQH